MRSRGDSSRRQVSEERRLEIVRLAEENKRLREAEKQRLSEVETLRMNGEDLRLKLKEAVDAHDETVKAAKERELEHEQLVSGLVSEAEHVNEIILGKNVFLSFLHLDLRPFLSDLASLICRLLSRGGRASPESRCFCSCAARILSCCRQGVAVCRLPSSSILSRVQHAEGCSRRRPREPVA